MRVSQNPVYNSSLYSCTGPFRLFILFLFHLITKMAFARLLAPSACHGGHGHQEAAQYCATLLRRGASAIYAPNSYYTLYVSWMRFGFARTRRPQRRDKQVSRRQVAGNNIIIATVGDDLNHSCTDKTCDSAD